jgi:hypothetical protein
MPLYQDLPPLFIETPQEEFERIARPLINYLCENHHPHTTIIVTCTNAELLEGKMTTGYIEDYLTDLTMAGTNNGRHPKCKGYTTPDYGNGSEYDCGYGTTITCDECKYCLNGGGRKNPEAKSNQPK